MEKSEQETIARELDDKKFGILFDRKLFWLADWADRIAWIVIFVAIGKSILYLVNYYGYRTPLGGWPNVSFIELLYPVLGEIVSIVGAFVTYIILQAISEIIYLLMEIRELVEPIEDTSEED